MIGITGASGHLGRLVAQALVERVSPTKVRLGSRDPAKLEDFAAQGFATTITDFEKPESLAKAFSGVETLLIISSDAPNDVCIRQHIAAIDAARAAGVGRVVYTSFTNARVESLFPFVVKHVGTEAYLLASGLPYTILRNNQYSENIPDAAARETGKLTLPGASGKVAHITRTDAAAAAAGALTQKGHERKIYEITGPEALDLFDIADILSSAWNRKITAVDLDPSEYDKLLSARGLPPFVVDGVVGLRKAVGAGEYAAISQDAGRLAGRPPQPLSDYLKSIPK